MVFVSDANNRHTCGEVVLTHKENLFTAIVTNNGEFIKITGKTYKDAKILAGSFIEKNRVRVILMQRTNTGYSGIYCSLLEDVDHYRSHYEWIRKEETS